MSKRTMYISIPMAGYDELMQRNRAKFWQRYWELLGYEVVNPFELGDLLKASYLNITGKEPTYAEYLHEDLINLEFCSDIFMCNGWTNSYGCMEECDKSIVHNIQFHFESKIKIQ